MALPIEQTALFFKLLSDPTRLRIIHVLLNTKEKICVSDIADRVGMSHSAVSHQLSKLESANIVTCTRNGQTMCYQLVGEKIRELLATQLHLVENGYE